MKVTRFLFPVLLFIWISGCARIPFLVPDPASKARIMEKTAVEEVRGVYVAASGDAWVGKEQVREHVTPVKISIKNNHGSLLKISYSLFSLKDSSGLLYAALPPYSIRGSIQEPVPASNYYCPGFYVAPYYSPYYPRLYGYMDPFYYDPFYYEHYYNCWKEIDLPTKEMLDKAIPEGVLDKGALASGFLFFQKIGEAERYTFEMDLVDAKSGERFGTISIPFIKKK